MKHFGMGKAIATFVAFSVLAGVAVTAGLAPAIGLTGATASASADTLSTLPDYLVIGSESQQNIIYAQRGGKSVQIATIFNQNRQEVAWDDVSPFLKDAAVDGEDRRFYTHGGVDFPSIARAAIGNLTSSSIQSGSSTIDMQLVKNILLQQSLQITNDAARKKAYLQAIDDTFQRKLKEMKLAVGLDKKYTKQQILLAYLNITGFGGNYYGVQSGAQRYFSVNAKDVTLAQAASLVAIVQQPNLQNLSDPKLYAANKIRRDQILNDMFAEKHITKAQFDEAIATPIGAEVKLSSTGSGCLYASDAQFACDYVNRLMSSLKSLGNTAKERAAAWANGGFKVYTSIDLDQQDTAQTQINKSAPASESRFALGAVADAVQPGTGKILVMAQNKKYDNSGTGDAATTTAVNYSVDAKYGSSSGFQTGSTFKIFTLTDWLQNGHGLYDTVNGSVRPFDETTFKASCAAAPFGGVYTPNNDSPGEGGSMSVLSATERSVNAAYVGMAQKLDLCDIRDDAMAMGVHRADGSPLYYGPTSVLGVNEIAPLTMASAIATIGAGGVYCAPTIIDKVTGPGGTSLAGQPTTCAQSSITPEIASTVAYALAGVMKSGTGSSGNPFDGVPIAGKTGTTDGSYQNWLIATTTKAALAVWVGNIDGTPRLRTTDNPQGNQSLRQITVAGTNGYNTKFNIFRTIMKSLNTNPNYRGVAFPVPDKTTLRGSAVIVPQVVGQSIDIATSVLKSLGFSVVNGGTTASSLPAGQVASSDPASGTSASLGDTVTLMISDGSITTTPSTPSPSASAAPTVTMPAVSGHSRSAAVTTLTNLGFSRSALSYRWIAGTPSDRCTVSASSPAANTVTTTDHDVVLTVSNGTLVAGVDPGSACP